MKKLFMLCFMILILLTSCEKETVQEDAKKEFPNVEDEYNFAFFKVYKYEEFDCYADGKLFCYIVSDVDLILSKNNINLYDSSKNQREWKALQYTLDYYNVDDKYKSDTDTLYYLKTYNYYFLDEDGNEYFEYFVAIIQNDDKYIIIVK